MFLVLAGWWVVYVCVDFWLLVLLVVYVVWFGGVFVVLILGWVTLLVDW